MRIYFERSGGLMGKPMTATVDTASLPTDEAKSWREMVLQSSFFALPEALASAPEGPDQFEYKVVVEVEQVSHTVKTTDGAAPDSLRPLLRRLTVATRTPSSSTLPR